MTNSRRVDVEIREATRDHAAAIMGCWRFGLQMYVFWPERPWEWMHGGPFLYSWYNSLPLELPGMKSDTTRR